MLKNIMGRIFRLNKVDHNFIPTGEILKQNIDKIKEQAISNVDQQIGRLDIVSLEKSAYNKLYQLDKGIMHSSQITRKITGTIPLLEFGEYSYLLFLEIAKENKIPSTILQPFCNASEIMIYISYCLIADENTLKDFIKLEKGSITKKASLYDLIESFGNQSLELVLSEHKHNRNKAAHSYQEISMDVARSFIQRTYEGIQRMELIINP